MLEPTNACAPVDELVLSRSMGRGRRVIILSLIAVIGASLIATSVAAAEAPRLLRTDVTATFAVHPATLFFGCCGQFFIGGPGRTSQAPRKHQLGHIHWTSWKAVGAKGTGTLFMDNCSPNCAEGTYVPYPVVITAWRVRSGRYTRLELVYTYNGHAERDVRQLKPLGSNGVYQWL